MVKNFSVRLIDRVSGKMNCIKCGRKANLYENNYADLDFLSKGSYAFPKRIEAPVLKGNENDFLCENCINNFSEFKIKCRIHGVIQEPFQGGLPPICKACADEAKQIVHWTLPNGYSFMVEIHSAITNSGDTIQNLVFVQSRSLEIFLFSKTLIDLGQGDIFNQNISFNEDSLIFSFSTSPSCTVKNCNIFVGSHKIPKSRGYWPFFWEDEIRKCLKLKSLDTPTALATIQFFNVPNNSFNQKIGRPTTCLLAVENGHILTYPEMNIPAIEKISSWKIIHQSSLESIALAYSNEGIPGKCVITNIPGVLKIEASDYLKNHLTSLLRHSDYPIDKKGIFDLYFPPKETKQVCLLEIEEGKISTIQIDSQAQITYSYYMAFEDKIALISSNYKEIAIFYPSNVAVKDVVNTLFELEDLSVEDSCRTGIYFEKNIGNDIFIVKLFKNIFTINDTPFKYSEIININLIKLNERIYNVVLSIVNTGKTESFSFIATEKYAYNTKRAFELYKIRENTVSLSEAGLYQVYNDLKKFNLLTGIFSDIILLKRELNNEKSMKEIAQRLEQINANQLFDDKKLYEVIQRKILMLSILLPKIKQNFEYLALYYPYYHLKNEIELITGTFGEHVAQKMLPGERKRIISSSRNNVRNVQSKIQTIINEIEKAVFPIEQLLSKEELRSTLSAKLLKYFPHGGQAVLLGTLIATTGGMGGVGVIAGMLGIRTISDILNYFRNDRETAAQIKKAFEKAYPWWQLLEDTMPLAIFETNETIAEDNNYSVHRDSKIFQQFPKEKQAEVAGKMRMILNKKIQEGTESKFLEILEGSGIRFETLISDIEKVIDTELPENLEIITRTFSLPHLKAHEERKNG